MSASKLRIYHRLQLVAHRLQKEADREISRVAGLTTAQAAVITVIDQYGETTQKTVAQDLGLNESALTAMVERLLKLGFLNRTRSKDDGRVRLLTLTKSGSKARTKMPQAFKPVNTRIEAELSARELEKLAEYLNRIAGSYQDD